MKRALVPLVTLLASLLVPIAVAGPASAQCAPDGPKVIYKISDKNFVYYPTNVRSDWASWPRGGTITYQQTKTMEANASVTATVSAEAGAIFASASVSAGVTVGGSYSQSKTWSYSANVPADKDHKYRLHAYHYALNFKVTKYQWVGGSTCDYKVAAHYPQRVHHAPAKSANNIWKLDKRAA